MVRVEQTSEEQINLNVEPFSSAVAGRTSNGFHSDGNEEELLLVGQKFSVESPLIARGSKHKATKSFSEARNEYNLEATEKGLRKRKQSSRSPASNFRGGSSPQRGSHSSA